MPWRWGLPAAGIRIPGNYAFRFTVSDKDGAWHGDEVTVRNRFVAFAANSLEIKANAIITGDVGAPNAALDRTLTERGVEVTAGTNAALTAGSAVFADSLLVRSRGSVPLAFFNSNSFIGPASGSGITARHIVFCVGGINGQRGNIGGNPKSATLGVHNTVHANFYVPNGTMLLQANTEATGAFIGRDVEVGTNVTLTLDSAFQ